MKIILATDAWKPQVNGVVRTYENVIEQLSILGHEIIVISPEQFKTFPCPTYPSIRLAFLPGKGINQIIDREHPDAIHIATEGPIGQAARKYCLKQALPFTTSYHTQFPEYIKARIPVPLSLGYSYVRNFHSKANSVLVPTNHMKLRLNKNGFRNVLIWSRGVNTELFKPRSKGFLKQARPIFTYMGRVAVEKNIEAFLELDLPGSKLVIGDGPALDKLKQCFPDVEFVGFKFGEELASLIAASDVFVFPSLTDTFGIVLLEAMACGVPVAAFPVTGPIDVVKDGITGILSEDLKEACIQALELDPDDCVEYASSFSWLNSAETFMEYLVPIKQ